MTVTRWFRESYRKAQECPWDASGLTNAGRMYGFILVLIWGRDRES